MPQCIPIFMGSAIEFIFHTPYIPYRTQNSTINKKNLIIKPDSLFFIAWIQDQGLLEFLQTPISTYIKDLIKIKAIVDYQRMLVTT